MGLKPRWPKSYHLLITQSTNGITILMAIAGAALVVSGIFKAFQGDDEAGRDVAIGLAFAGLALAFRWLALKWYGFLNQLANKDD